MGALVLRLPVVVVRLVAAGAGCLWRAWRARRAFRRSLLEMGLPPRAVARLSGAYGPPDWLLRPWSALGRGGR